MLNQSISLIRRKLRKSPSATFPLVPQLPLPEGVTEQELFDFVTSIRVQDAPEAEMKAYATHDFRRFVYTWGLTRKMPRIGRQPLLHDNAA